MRSFRQILQWDGSRALRAAAALGVVVALFGFGLARAAAQGEAPAPVAVSAPRPSESGAAQAPPPAATSPAPPAALAPIEPPLSVHESCLRLRDLIATLEAPGAESADADLVRHWMATLRSVSAYVERVDQAHPTLPQYTWTRVVGEKIPDGRWTTRRFPLIPLPGITALALRAHNADVEVRELTAIDENRTRWQFKRKIMVRGDQLRPEVCFISPPMRLREIEVTARWAGRQSDQNKPRLFIEAGRSATPESGKQALHHMERARAEMEQRRCRQAAGALRQAFAALEEFRRTRGL